MTTTNQPQVPASQSWCSSSRYPEPRCEDEAGQYLYMIGQVPLLTAEQEVACAQRIERGVSAHQKLQACLDLSRRDQAQLDALVHDGAVARQTLIEANLRLVVSIAKDYARQQEMTLLDLVQEGNIGLMRAVMLFDWRKGCRFSTYATWWIKQAIRRAFADQHRLIRLPVHLGERVSRMQRVQRELEQVLERAPTRDEVATVMGVHVQLVEQWCNAIWSTVSWEHVANEEGQAGIGQHFSNEQHDGPLENVMDRGLHRELAHALVLLSEREQQVLVARYGLADGKARSFVEVGRMLALSRERVRQIEAEALARLRSMDGMRYVKSYLE